MKYTVLFTIASTLFVAIAHSTTLQGSYIVKLNDESRISINAHIQAVESLFKNKSDNNKIESIFNHIGSMYHAKFTEEIAKKVINMDGVEYVEPDSEVQGTTVQINAPWGLARISQRPKLGATKNYNYVADGAGVTVYVIDSGILINHPEFEGRARFGARFITNNNNDENGHGTHCAGTVGSKTYGVSKKANLVAVKVLDATNRGSVSGIISGINWAAGDKKGVKGNVMSMSLGAGKSQAFNDAAKAAVKKDFVVVVAAGNDNIDACRVSPASEPSVITVAAMDVNDARASFSNWGSCVDVFGPGVNVLSTWNNGGTNTISGTSMATPHVSGLAAYLLSQKSESASAITAKIISLSSKNLISNPGFGTPNLLIYNGIN